MHNWSEEYFIIVERLSRIPPVYRLKDLNKVFSMSINLQKVAPGELYPISKVLKRRGTHAYG